MRATVLVALIATAVGCFTQPIRLRAEYTPMGPVGETQPVRTEARSPDNVRVWYKTSPDGFTLGENELQVEAGFQHIILGEIIVVRQDGYCDLPLETVNTPDGRRYRYTNQRDVLAALRQKASLIGANAVVYAYSNLKQKSERFDACQPLRRPDQEYGGGWAVIVR